MLTGEILIFQSRPSIPDILGRTAHDRPLGANRESAVESQGAGRPMTLASSCLKVKNERKARDDISTGCWCGLMKLVAA